MEGGRRCSKEGAQERGEGRKMLRAVDKEGGQGKKERGKKKEIEEWKQIAKQKCGLGLGVVRRG